MASTLEEIRQAVLGAMFIADAEPCADREGGKVCNYCKATYVAEAVQGMLDADQ